MTASPTRVVAGCLLAALATLAAACSGGPPEELAFNHGPPAMTEPLRESSWAPIYDRETGLERFSGADGTRLWVNTAGGVRDFVAGVNLGATVPGKYPGEHAIDRLTFRQWFPQMADLGFRALRIYTILSPEFYEELRDYNLANPDEPLLLVHGAWIPEERFLETRDLFDPAVREGFKAELDRSVAVVHGDAVLPERRGHASGTYTADVSPWLLSWAIGVEWDPEATAESDATNQGRAPFAGEYFRSSDGASPTESWLAEMLDHLAGAELEQGVTMPLTFVNWPTTDPLTHPSEPLPEEDQVGVDANNISVTAAWPGGYYASYHAYPYYPDFQRYEPGIADYELDGEVDNYAGYLASLAAHHEGLPVVISEFGVPSGWAHAHFGPLGRNQGEHSEQGQMAINADLLDIIERTGLEGGYVFEWADEWFKFTWNTIDFELPWDRRALWMNTLTNEAHFGVLAVEPGESPPVTIDGDDSEWTTNGSQVVAESRGTIREIRAHRDEGYLYLRLVTDEPEIWAREPIMVGFDVVSGTGGGLPGRDGVHSEADYALTIGPGDVATVSVRASNDPYLIQYGAARDFFPVDAQELEDGSGVWNPYRLIVNRPLTVPSTGEEFETEFMEPGRLRSGSSDPSDPAFDSRTAWKGSGSVIEVRLPWQLIGFADPSSLQSYRITPEGAVVAEQVDRIGITAVLGSDVLETNGYAWEPWQRPQWHERMKAGADVLRLRVNEANDLPSS